MKEGINIGIVISGIETVNKLNLDISGWKIETYKDTRENGGAYIYLYQVLDSGEFKYWYDYWVEKEEDIEKFFSETDWKIEWQK